MLSPNADYDDFCASEGEVEATEGKMLGGMLQALEKPDLPEAAVAKLSMDDALALRTQLAMGRAPIDQSVQELEQQQVRWLASAVPPDDPRSYLHRQRLALELRFRMHTQKVFHQQVRGRKGVLGPCHHVLVATPSQPSIHSGNMHTAAQTSGGRLCLHSLVVKKCTREHEWSQSRSTGL